MAAEKSRAVTHDGDIVKIDGKPVRMEYLVRDAFWAGGHAIVLLDPDAYFDDPAYGGRTAATSTSRAGGSSGRRS
jgi:hypothetical protein